MSCYSHTRHLNNLGLFSLEQRRLRGELIKAYKGELIKAYKIIMGRDRVDNHSLFTRRRGGPERWQRDPRSRFSRRIAGI